MSDVDYAAIQAETKRVLIDAFWDNVEQRVEFLDQLVVMGRFSEALTLCATYLDGVAGALAGPSAKNGQAFCSALAAHEPTPYFSLIHPLQAIRETASMNGDWPSISKKLEVAFPPPDYKLLTAAEFLEGCRAVLSQNELVRLENELWRASLAGVAYYWIRNPAVHELGGASTIGFSSTSFDGNPVSSMSLPELLPVLKRMIVAARANSHAKGSWP